MAERLAAVLLIREEISLKYHSKKSYILANLIGLKNIQYSAPVTTLTDSGLMRYLFGVSTVEHGNYWFALEKEPHAI